MLLGECLNPGVGLRSDDSQLSNSKGVMTASVRQEGGCRKAARRQEGVRRKARDLAGRLTQDRGSALPTPSAFRPRLRGPPAIALLPPRGLHFRPRPPSRLLSPSARRRIAKLEMHSSI
jgi:hypothetical protein